MKMSTLNFRSILGVMMTPLRAIAHFFAAAWTKFLHLITTKTPPRKGLASNKGNLLLEIQQFDKSNLQKQTVYYVNGAIGHCAFKPKTHGFAVVGMKATAKKAGFAQPFYLGASIMHAHFNLNEKVIKKIIASKDINKSTKDAIELMKRQEYPTAEHFLRKLLYQKARLQGQSITAHVQQKILYQATNPDAELKAIVEMNVSINGRGGAVLCADSNSPRRVRDRRLFESGSYLQTSKAYPQIDPDILREVYQQQRLYAQYMDEQAGIGKATNVELKKRAADHSKAARVVANLASYKLLPEKDDMFSSNCNKSTASLLQLAEDRSAKKQGRMPMKITGASMWAIGAQQRLFLWDPLTSNLSAIVHQLIEHNKIDFIQTSLQYLADNKRGILHIISNLPTEKKIRALRSILNNESMLSQIFHTRRSGEWFTPSPSRGYLLKAKKMLEVHENQLQTGRGVNPG